ncbi:hypothetical protein BurJ1DRAFT_2838 [Burkholderiales bacterium JOSHI_001]|nr:hypothetical protein BurJ1DRAFT_2838 [Burkholderiales bacterium JOSHI_001]
MAPELPSRRALDGRAPFETEARALLTGLPDSACREAWLVDADLAEWPLGQADVLDALTRWLRLPGRRLNLLALQFDSLALRQARFAAWRVNFVHALDSRTPEDLEPDDMPCLLLAGPCCIRVHDRLRWRGSFSQETEDLQRVREQIAAISQRSAPSWPVRGLGL